jgi:hypothetical protein
MRRVAALLIAPALALAGCSSPCQELGDRLCRCRSADTSRSSCERQVKDQIDDLDPSESVCEEKLDTCEAPDGVDFCDWILTECGKASCGFSLGEPGEVCP